MMSSDEGRRAYERCWREQDEMDALPIERSGCAISVRRRESEETTGEEEFVGRVIVRYREEHELEKSFLEVAIRSRAEAASILAAGRTPPPKRLAEGASDVEELAAIEELASVFGDRPENVEKRLRGCHERGEPFVPGRFRELLGRERVYEVRSKLPSNVLTAIRCFLLRIASAATWSHWGVIDGPVRVELPLRYDVTFIDTPGINSSSFIRERVLRPVIGDAGDERFGMFLFVCGTGAPRASTWDALERMGTLKKILIEGARVCLCWPMERMVKSNRPGGFLTNLQIKNFANKTMNALKTEPNHWKLYLDRFMVSSNLSPHGDLSHGLSLAFVRATSAEPPGDKVTDRQFCLFRLAYAIEQQVKPPPPRDANSDNFPEPAPTPGVDETKQPAKPHETPVETHVPVKIAKPQDKRKQEIAQKPSSPPKSTIAPKKRPRECTIADPFAFTEDDAVLFPPQEETETTPVFGKKARTVLKNTANSRARATGSTARAAKSAKTVPKPSLPLATADAQKISPQLSATPTSKQSPTQPPNCPPSPQPRRPLRDHARAKSPWWETKNFSWEHPSNIR